MPIQPHYPLCTHNSDGEVPLRCINAPERAAWSRDARPPGSPQGLQTFSGEKQLSKYKQKHYSSPKGTQTRQTKMEENNLYGQTNKYTRCPTTRLTSGLTNFLSRKAIKQTNEYVNEKITAHTRNPRAYKQGKQKWGNTIYIDKHKLISFC